MIDFIGTHTWEELCREWVLRAGALGHLPFMSDQVGSAWDREAQIDVGGLNRMEKTLILGECKWTLNEVERKVMAELVEEKAAKIIPELGQWRIYIPGFFRSGWTTGALAYQNEINQKPASGVNWVSTGMRLITMEDIHADLTAWSV